MGRTRLCCSEAPTDSWRGGGRGSAAEAQRKRKMRKLKPSAGRRLEPWPGGPRSCWRTRQPRPGAIAAIGDRRRGFRALSAVLRGCGVLEPAAALGGLWSQPVGSSEGRPCPCVRILPGSLATGPRTARCPNSSELGMPPGLQDSTRVKPKPSASLCTVELQALQYGLHRSWPQAAWHSEGESCQTIHIGGDTSRTG